MELGFDGDNTANDVPHSGEVFVLGCDVGGDLSGWQADTDWIAVVDRQATGYTVEFRLRLDLIDTVDGAGEKRPEPGDYIGFLAAVVDDDDGEEGYKSLIASSISGTPTPVVDSYGMWAGAQRTNTQGWGYLFFDPTPAETAVGETTWGSLKQLSPVPSR